MELRSQAEGKKDMTSVKHNLARTFVMPNLPVQNPIFIHGSMKHLFVHLFKFCEMIDKKIINNKKTFLLLS